jgi:Kdo2-lipid IVA lauroyltransferase/acyltransferase
LAVPYYRINNVDWLDLFIDFLNINMGSRIVYYGVILPISVLPFPILYALSDLTYLVLYKMLGYRKKVVLGNIQRSFPDKTDKEHRQIMNQFYHHFCDLMVESLKCFTISQKQIAKRMKFRNNEILADFYKNGQDLIMIGGHYNNWEYIAVALGLGFDFLPVGIYKPLTNKFFDEKMRKSRGKYGLLLTPMKETSNTIAKDFGKPKAIVFGADQSPSNPDKAFWTTFLNQPTPVFYGPEKFAKEFNMPAVFSTIHKVKRGYYEVEHQIICANSAAAPYGYITKQHVQFLENDIRHQPQYWLWTHKRWKHKPKSDTIIS